MKEMEFAEEVLKYLKCSELKTKDYIAPKDVQARYLAKRLRQSAFYTSLDEKERANIEKAVKKLVDEYCKDEECEIFSFNDLYYYLVKTFY